MSAVNCLREAFKDVAAHIAVHVQRVYCDPEYVMKRRSAYYARGVEQLVTDIDEFADRARGRLMNIWIKHTAEPDQKAQELSGKPKPASDKIFEESSYNALANDALRSSLEESGVQTVLLTGLLFNLCIVETAVGARINGFNTFIIRDLTNADTSPRYPAFPETLALLEDEGIHIVSRAEVQAALDMRL